MDAGLVAKVRRFNRTVTHRIGALDDRYLARDRPLGAARVLWEVGEDGCEVRRLRARLGLDSGYLSRILRSLEAAGLVTVVPSEADRRVRTARLTTKGLAERRVLDRRSDDLAASMLEALPGPARERLVAAMDEVERLLTAAQIRIGPVDPAEPDAQHCLREYYAELDRRFDTGYDPARALPVDLDEMRPPAGTFLVATLHGEPVACGALKSRADSRGDHVRSAAGSTAPRPAPPLSAHPLQRRDDAPVEVKRMWVAPTVRGLGVGRWLMSELEAAAAAMGAEVVRLDTNGTLTEAIAMYRSCGYHEIDRYNEEPYADHWFEKRLRS